MPAVVAPTADEICAAALPLLLPFGLRRLSLFGSTARGESGPESDIDLLVELAADASAQLDLLAWVGLELELARVLGRPVEMIRPQALNPKLRPFVDEDIVVLYEAP